MRRRYDKCTGIGLSITCRRDRVRGPLIEGRSHLYDDRLRGFARRTAFRSGDGPAVIDEGVLSRDCGGLAKGGFLEERPGRNWSGHRSTLLVTDIKMVYTT